MSVVTIEVLGRDKATPVFDATGKSLGKLTTTVEFQTRQLKQLEAALAATTARHGADSVQAQRDQLAVDKLSSSLATNRGKIDETTAALTREQQELQNLGQGLASHAESVDHASSSFGKLGETAKGALMGIGFAAVNAGLNAVSSAFTSVEHSVIGTNAQLQDSATSWGVLLGSADKAQAKLNDLSKFAAVTPFDFPEVDHAAKLLDTFGGAALDTTKTLTLVGDVASGVNQPFSEVAMWTGRMYDAIQSGKPFGEAAARLQEMGAMSGQTRTQLEEMQKNGTDGAKIWDTFTTSMGRFGGMMQKQSQNWSGLTSTFSDSINLLAAQAGKPIFDELSKDLGHVNELLASPATEQAAKHFAEFAAGGVKQSIDGLAKMVDVGQNAAHVLSDNLHPAIVSVGAATLAYGATQLPTLIESTTLLIPKLYEQATALSASVGPLALVAGGIFYAIKAEDEYLAQARTVVEAQDKHNESLQIGVAALDRYTTSTTTQSAAADDMAAKVRDLTKAHDDAATTLQRWDTADAQTRRSMHLTNDEITALRGQVKGFDGQIVDAAGSLDMMTRAANQVEWDKANPPKGVWSAYQGEVEAATTAIVNLGTFIRPTADEMKTLTDELQKAQDEGSSTFSTLIASVGSSYDQLAQTTAQHEDAIAQLVKDRADAKTSAARQAIDDRIAAENVGYASQLAAQTVAQGEQLASQRQALGEMLINQITTMAQLGQVSQERAAALVAGIRTEYGVLPDLAKTSFGAMEASINQWAGDASISAETVIGKLHTTGATADSTRQLMEQMAKKYEAELVENFKEGKIDADQLKTAIAAIPSRVQSLLNTNWADELAQIRAIGGAMGALPTSKLIRIEAGIDPMLVRHSPSPIEQVMMAVDDFSKRDHIFRFNTVGDLGALASYSGAANPLAYLAPSMREMPAWAGYVKDLGNGLRLLGDQTPAIQDLGDGLTLLGDQWARQADGMTDLAPKLPQLAAGFTGVADAAKAAAAATTRATDDILNHISFNGENSDPFSFLTRSGGLGASADMARQAGNTAGMTFGDGWQSGIQQIAPVMQDTTRLTFDQMQQTVLIPWQDQTRDFFSGAGFGFIGAAATGMTSAGNGLAADAARVGGAAGAALVGGLKGNLAGVGQAVADINAALAKIERDITVHVHTVYDGTGGSEPPHRAGGGPVTAGRPYIVGENRPELFVPQENGYILPRVPSTLAGQGQSTASGQMTARLPASDLAPLVTALSDIMRAHAFDVVRAIQEAAPGSPPDFRITELLAS